MAKVLCLLLIMTVLGTALGKGIDYHVDADNRFQRVLIPVSSTVIPLDELPVLNVGFGFQYDEIMKDMESKPSNIKKLGLLTKKSAAKIKELTKDKFETQSSGN